MTALAVLLTVTRVGIIGCDTSHTIAFTKTLNVDRPDYAADFRVTAAHKWGSRDIVSSTNRYPKYIAQLKEMGVEMCETVDDLLAKVDVVCLETNDGREHLWQSEKCFKAKKRVFIDKPIAEDYPHAKAIYDLGRKYGAEYFSTSTLRYASANAAARTCGTNFVSCVFYAPCPLETQGTHSRYVWYGIHAFETAMTVMGCGAVSVRAYSAGPCDFVTITWAGGRVANLKLDQKSWNYGGYAFPPEGAPVPLSGPEGYGPMLKGAILPFFRTGVVPVPHEETLEMFAIMDAAAKSHAEDGREVAISEIVDVAAEAVPASTRVWTALIDPPTEYLNFPRMVTPVAKYACADFDVEVYSQSNGPDTCQRVMMAIPRGLKGKAPCIVVPFYFPEAMLGFNPKDGSFDTPLCAGGTNLTCYSDISYMSDLARRGYITASADAYYLTYARQGAPTNDWSKWGHVGAALKRDWPQWTGVGKLVFDTRLLVDLVAADSRVDADRIGIIGHSLGGKMAFYAGCLDPRIRVIVASDFGIGWTQTNWSDAWYWGDRVKEMRSAGASHADLLSMSGAKPFCLIAGKYDDADSGAIMRLAKGYESDPGRLKLVFHGTGHRPPRTATDEGYRFLDGFLKP